MFCQFVVRSIVTIFAAGALASLATATPVDRYLGEDVLAVAYADLGQLDTAAVVNELKAFTLIPEQQLGEVRAAAGAVQAELDDLRRLGAERVHLLVRASDFFKGLTVAVEVKEGADPAAVIEKLKEFVAMLPEDARAYAPDEFAVEGGLIIGAASQERLDEVRKGGGEPRPDAIAAVSSLGDAEIGAVVFGDPDSRRVTREMFPQLPAPFMEIDGRLLAEHVKWIGVTAKFPPTAQFTLQIEADEAKTAALLEQSAAKGLTLLKGLALAASVQSKDFPFSIADLMKVIDLVQPKVVGAKLSITVTGDEETLNTAKKILGKPLQQAREAAFRAQRMNNFKQLSLGLLTYESAKREFPAQAVRGADGKPLLSWRVMILPYIEQQALYNSFNLDEPWDSKHNLTLLQHMPELFADPDPSVRMAAKGVGKTTFLSTAGAGMFFDGETPRTIRSVIDGTSNTAWLIEVEPERAVEWTRPDDWEVDASYPAKGLARRDGGQVTAAFLDGHVGMISTQNEPAVLRALFTPAGKEVIDVSSLK